MKIIGPLLAGFLVICALILFQFNFSPSSLPEVGEDEFLFTDSEKYRYAKFKHWVDNDSYELCLELLEFGDYVGNVVIEEINSHSKNFNSEGELIDTIEEILTDKVLEFENEGDHERFQLESLWDDLAARVVFEIEFNGNLICYIDEIPPISNEKSGSGEIKFSILKEPKSTWLPLDMTLFALITIGIFRKKIRIKF